MLYELESESDQLVPFVLLLFQDDQLGLGLIDQLEHVFELILAKETREPLREIATFADRFLFHVLFVV